MREDIKPDRVYDNIEYFSLTNAQKYFGMSKAGFQEYVKRLKVQKWEMPAGSKWKFIKKADLDKALAPAPATQAVIKKTRKGKLSIVQVL